MKYIFAIVAILIGSSSAISTADSENGVLILTKENLRD